MTTPKKFAISREELSYLMQIAERNVHREIVNGIYWQMLRRYVPLESIPKVDNAVVVNLGCGMATEADVQTEYVLENLLRSEDGKAHFVGIDHDPSKIELAIGRIYNSYGGRVSYRFIHGDARELDAILPKSAHVKNADVFFLSHPETVGMQQVWEEIIGAMKQKHSKDGLLIATFYDKDEMEALRTMLGKDYAVLAVARNDGAREDPHVKGMYSHKFLLAARRL